MPLPGAWCMAQVHGPWCMDLILPRMKRDPAPSIHHPLGTLRRSAALPGAS